jgi:hypothetical protein
MAESEKKVEESARTRVIKSMPENVLQKGAAYISEKLDKLGITEKEKYEGKTADDLTKKRAGGKISSASKRADGCAQRGKTRGRMV